MNARRNDGPWLSVSGAARALGVSSSTLRLWASEGRIPHVRTAGGHRRFDPEELRQWLARQPARGGRTGRRGSSHLARSTVIAQLLRERSGAVADEVEDLVEGPSEAAYRRLSVAERRSIVRSWVDSLADAFEKGSLADALELAETYGRGHGLAASSAEVTLGGSMALERGIDRALARAPAALEDSERRQVVAAMSQLTVRVATAWASAIAGRTAPRPVISGERRG